MNSSIKTTSASHTPGPWETSALSDGTQWTVCGPDGGDMIADLTGNPNEENDARLISAAPELLAVLVRVTNELEHGGASMTAIRSMVQDARAAIAKADGLS
jgi:hypothetical protein